MRHIKKKRKVITQSNRGITRHREFFSRYVIPRCFSNNSHLYTEFKLKSLFLQEFISL